MIIAIDFDGTCVTHEYPEVGKDIGAIPVLRRLVDHGHQLILWTMRHDDSIGIDLEPRRAAVGWFRNNGIPLFGVNRNPNQRWSGSPKAYAQLYIDDAALGCPLKVDENISSRPFVDWVAVEKLLEESHVITTVSKWTIPIVQP